MIVLMILLFQNGNLGITTCIEEDFFASTEENVKKELQKIKQVGKTRTDSRKKVIEMTKQQPLLTFHVLSSLSSPFLLPP